MHVGLVQEMVANPSIVGTRPSIALLKSIEFVYYGRAPSAKADEVRQRNRAWRRVLPKNPHVRFKVRMFGRRADL